MQFIRRRGRLLRAGEIGPSAVEEAQRATYAKMVVEVPDLQKIGIDAGTIDRADVAQWATAGQQVWKLGLTGEAKLFDAPSIALVTKLRGGNPTGTDIAPVIARLEQHVLADTALNQFQLRQQIRMQLASRKDLAFAPINDWIYTNVFRTPKTDPWLGLLENTDFTGLPADGVVMP
jgi:hypothetical protein